MTTLQAYLDSQRPHTHGPWEPVARVNPEGPDIEWCPNCGAVRQVQRPETD